MTTDKEPLFRSAFVGLIGRPNCGKSTLMNTLIGEQLSIVTALPQTTRRIIRGIWNAENLQVIFIDTPGIHQGRHSLNKAMLAQSTQLLRDDSCDILCYIVDLSRTYGDEEDSIASLLRNVSMPVLVVFNKTDLCGNPDSTCDLFFRRYPHLSVHRHVSVSALSADARDIVLDALVPMVKPGPLYFPRDDLSDVDMRFLAAEFIRKQVIESTREEVPHAVCVEIASYTETEGKHAIDAVIHVESQGQKGIVIGEKGRLINKIRHRACRDIEKFTGTSVSVRVHVRVTPGWRDDRRFLKEMGLETAG